jgi:hypothetical protein
MTPCRSNTAIRSTGRRARSRGRLRLAAGTAPSSASAGPPQLPEPARQASAAASTV